MRILSEVHRNQLQFAVRIKDRVKHKLTRQKVSYHKDELEFWLVCGKGSVLRELHCSLATKKYANVQVRLV